MKAVLFLCLLVPSIEAEFQWSEDEPAENPSPITCSSNYASCGCCLMMKQTERMMEFFNYTHDHLSTYLTKTKNAINQIRATTSVFSVALASQSQCLGPFSMNKNITYGTVFINQGNNYNTATGVYTAPVSGVYSLSVTIYSNFAGQGQTKACANLCINGNTVTELKEKSSGDHQDSSSAAITRQLHAGDKVSVVQPPGCAFCGSNNNHNTFTGFLLYLKD